MCASPGSIVPPSSQVTGNNIPYPAEQDEAIGAAFQAACSYTCGRCPPSYSTGQLCMNYMGLLTTLDSKKSEADSAHMWTRLLSKAAFTKVHGCLIT